MDNVSIMDNVLKGTGTLALLNRSYMPNCIDWMKKNIVWVMLGGERLEFVVIRLGFEPMTPK